jgi:5-methylcytosine-specific restriction endonuclease McrA
MIEPDLGPSNVFDEAYADRFGALAAAIADRRPDDATREVKALANPGALGTLKRPNASLRRWCAVFKRDCYTCRYCGRRTIAPPVLRVVSHLFPTIFKYHPNWKTSETDAAYFVLSTSADHVVPVTRYGSDDVTNLVTACWTCNGQKSNYLLSELPSWKLAPILSSSWLGLTEHLDQMIEAGGLQKDSYLRRWAGAIRNPEIVETPSS